MKNFFNVLILLCCLLVNGCGVLSPKDNFNPRLKQEINNQQGKIDRIENIQNALKAEIERLSLINRENNNQGVQILQGEGGLFLVFCLITNFFIMLYFYRISEGERKTTQILAEQIVKHQDKCLEDNILSAIENTNLKKKILTLLGKSV